MEIFTLEGGYKSFRNFILNQFEVKYPFVVIGGRTGSGKTRILHQLKSAGQQVIDLEGIANHKGSAFGAIGQQTQPRQEHFENLLGMALYHLDLSKPVFIEDESRKVGNLQIPDPVWNLLRNSSVLYIDVPADERIKNLVEDYGTADYKDLEHSIIKIRENLGGANAKSALDFLAEGNLSGCCKILLDYYDKTYDYGISIREKNLITKTPYSEKDLIGQIVHHAETLERIA